MNKKGSVFEGMRIDATKFKSLIKHALIKGFIRFKTREIKAI